MSIDHGKLLALADKWKALADTPHDVADDYNAGQIWAYAVAQAQLREALAQPAEAVELPTPYHYADGGKGEPMFTANQVRAAVAVAADAAQGAVAWMNKHGSVMTDELKQEFLATGGGSGYDQPLYTHPQAATAQGDGEMAKIGRLIETQDNRITEAPIFIVQQKRWICGVDPDYGGERVWINHARESVEITDEAEIARLDAEYAEEYTAPEGYTLTGKMHVWDFVTACFTEQGCKDYLARDGHNLCEPRIYAAGSYRNEEWRSVRKFLMSLAAAPAQVPLIARAKAEWHEDDGAVMWWAWCGHEWAGEPAWCGTPNDSDWPGYHTHWTSHPKFPAAPSHEGES